MLEIVFLYSFAKGKLCEKVKKLGVEYREEPFICSRMGSPFIYILFLSLPCSQELLGLRKRRRL